MIGSCFIDKFMHCAVKVLLNNTLLLLLLINCMISLLWVYQFVWGQWMASPATGYEKWFDDTRVQCIVYSG